MRRACNMVAAAKVLDYKNTRKLITVVRSIDLSSVSITSRMNRIYLYKPLDVEFRIHVYILRARKKDDFSVHGVN